MTAHASTAWRRPQLAGWFAIVVLVSLGIGGLVVTIDHAPSDVTRPELTARRDRAAAEGIAALARGVATLSDRIGALRQVGLDAIVHTAAGDPKVVATDALAGDGILRQVDAASADVRSALGTLPTGLDRTGLSQANQAKLARVEDALAAAAPLPDSWRRIGRGTVPEMQLGNVLVDHDGRIASATAAEGQRRYADALRLLGEATGLLDGAEALRQDAAAVGIDVAAVGEWLLRARVHDEALKKLMRILQQNGGKDTADAQAARARAEEAARAMPATLEEITGQLSSDGQAIVNDATIAIDQVAGTLDDTTATLTTSGP